MAIHVGSQLSEKLMRLGKVLAIGPVALEQVRYGIAAKSIEPHLQPVRHHVQHCLANFRVVVIEIWLVAEEAVPVMLSGLGVETPVRRLGVGEDDAAVRITRWI